MKKTIILIAVLLGTQVALRAQTKIGYVSPDEIFALMPDVKAADVALAKYQEELAQAYKDSEEELNTAYAKFVKDSAQMNGAVKNAKRKDLQDRISGLQTKQTQLNEALETEKQRQLAPIREKMLKAIKDVAKEMGYDHVLYKESAILFPAAADFTNSVKKKLGIQ